MAETVTRTDDGAAQLADWMARRGFNQPQTADYFKWDLTFINKLLGRHRLPGLVNALIIERATGIPVEAWVPSELDTDEQPVPATRKKTR